MGKKRILISSFITVFFTLCFRKDSFIKLVKMLANRCLFLVLAISIPGFCQVNLLSNPSFEQDGNGWALQKLEQADATIEYTAAAAYNGNKGAQITVTAISDENWHVQLNLPNQWNAEKGKKYHLTFWAKADKPVIIHVAVQDGPQNNFEYRKGFDFSIDNSGWKMVEMSHLSDVEGNGELRLNLYIGGATGTYYFDEFVLDTVSRAYPTTISIPEKGAFETNIYRNLFKELGKSDTEIDEKVNRAFQQLFHGNDQFERLYFETGSDMAYLKAIGSDDIRTEGLSYGMMIAVQLNKKEEFDKIWKFCKTYAQHTIPERQGYFAWNLNSTTFAKTYDKTAPDGEEYFVMSLLFASHRWGDGDGVYNYSAEAQKLLHSMLHLEDDNGGVVNELVNMFNKQQKKVVFVPEGDDATFTDPSYHLPSFYKLWALWADEDKSFWSDAADTSKAYLMRAMHTTTSLTTDYMSFAGAPQPTSFNPLSDKFAYDSWRVGMNIGCDCHWFGDDQWQAQKVNTLFSFFKGQGLGNYKALYEQNGTPLQSDNYHSIGLVAANAAAALASNDTIAWNFIDELWDTPVPIGLYRYYDGMLYMLAMLHTSGKFRIWSPGNKIIKNPTLNNNKGNPNFKVQWINAVLSVTCLEPLNNPMTLSIHSMSGRTLVSQTSDKTVINIDCSNLSKGIYYLTIKSRAEKHISKFYLQ